MGRGRSATAVVGAMALALAGCSAGSTGAGDSGRCHTADLAVTNDGGQGAAGSFLGVMVFRNVSQATCTVDGYAGLLRLDASHHPLPTTVVRDGPGKPTLVRLAPQDQASFAYRYGETPQDGAPCPPAATVEVTPPDETTHVDVTPGGFAVCTADGRIDVAALQPGKNARRS